VAQASEEGRAPSVLESATGLARNALGLLLSRVELAAIELGEVRTQLLKLVLLGALGVVAAWFAIAWWSVLVAVLAWPLMGWKILALLALLFTVAAVLIGRRVLAILREDKLNLPATMAELRKDRDALL
jgi:uncharacterized membrane protein YqjE